MKIKLMSSDNQLVADLTILPFVTVPEVIFYGLRTFILYTAILVNQTCVPCYRETMGYVIQEPTQ